MSALDLSRPADLVVVSEGSLADTKRLADRVRALDIATWIGGQECCSKGGCGPKAALMVGPDDVPKVAALLRDDWVAALERESPGSAERLARLHGPEATDGELPCPACGTAGPLVSGACGDCGLQLE